MITTTRDCLAVVTMALLIALIVSIALSPEAFGMWLGKAWAGYVSASMDAMFGAPKQ